MEMETERTAMIYRDYAMHVGRIYLRGLKWILFGILCGIFVGAVSAEFANAIVFVTGFRLSHPWLIFFLPFAGLAIVFYYRLLGVRQPKGTNLVLEAIRTGDRVPGKMAPLIILSSILSHLFGASVGREGAALQVGGSLGNLLGRIFHFRDKDRRQLIMCGMSAAFSALFGTPLAAAVLAMEISTVGNIYYFAFVPCVVSALTAHLVAEFLGAKESAMLVNEVADFSAHSALLTILFAFLCALVSVLFCVSVHRIKALLNKYLENAYLRSLLAGLAVLSLTLAVGDQSYNGTGMHTIVSAVVDQGFRVAPYAFLLKILFTALSLAGGFQGGEIVPSLFIGAVFGNAAACLFGMDPRLFSAIGMTCVFCGVTNCPIAALLISCEMFGFQASSYFLMAVAITYLFSGNYGIYSAQKILYSRVSEEELNINAH